MVTRAGRAFAWWERLVNNENFVGYTFIAPLLLGLTIFTYGPVLIALGLSFTKGDYISTPKWIGLDNYGALLKDDLFWTSLKNTLYYVVGVVPVGLLLSLLLALALNQKLRGIVFFRSIFFLPSITSSVAISLMWLWIYNPEFGVLNFLLKLVGDQRPWLAFYDRMGDAGDYDHGDVAWAGLQHVNLPGWLAGCARSLL